MKLFYSFHIANLSHGRFKLLLFYVFICLQFSAIDKLKGNHISSIGNHMKENVYRCYRSALKFN